MINGLSHTHQEKAKCVFTLLIATHTYGSEKKSNILLTWFIHREIKHPAKAYWYRRKPRRPTTVLHSSYSSSIIWRITFKVNRFLSGSAQCEACVNETSSKKMSLHLGTLTKQPTGFKHKALRTCNAMMKSCLSSKTTDAMGWFGLTTRIRASLFSLSLKRKIIINRFTWNTSK